MFAKSGCGFPLVPGYPVSITTIVIPSPCVSFQISGMLSFLSPQSTDCDKGMKSIASAVNGGSVKVFSMRFPPVLLIFSLTPRSEFDILWA